MFLLTGCLATPPGTECTYVADVVERKASETFQQLGLDVSVAVTCPTPEIDALEASVQAVLGPTATIFDFRSSDQAFNTKGHVVTPATWSTVPPLKREGILPVVTLAQHQIAASSPAFSFSDGLADKPFSLVILFKQTQTAHDWFMFDKDTEWSFIRSGNSQSGLRHIIYLNDSGTVNGTRQMWQKNTTDLSVWQHMVVTYDGVNPNTGLRIYSDGGLSGNQANSTDVYTAMRPSASPLLIGGKDYYGQWFEGDLAGGPCAPTVVHGVALTQAQAQAHMQLCRDALGLSKPIPTLKATAEQNPTTFAVVGDGGTPLSDTVLVADRIAALSPQFLLYTGDLHEGNGDPGTYHDYFFRPYESTIKDTPIYPTIGNHERLWQDGAPWDGYFPNLPDNGPGRSYWFSWGDALFIAFDNSSNVALSSAEADWLAATLAKDYTWKFVYYHVPTYGDRCDAESDARYGNTTKKAALHALFVGRVDVVFQGHCDRSYERSHPIDGVRYITTAGGGGGVWGQDIPWNITDPDFAAAFIGLHTTYVQIDRKTITVSAIKADGVVADSFVWSKP